MEKHFEHGENINQLLDPMIAACRKRSMPFPYVILLLPANGGLSIAHATEQYGKAILKVDPPSGVAQSPIKIYVIDSEGGLAHFELSATGNLTYH
jgi:hypothetical protein